MFGRATLAWAATLVAASAPLAALVDGALVGRGAAALAAGALAIVAAVVIAPLPAGVARASEWLARRRPALRPLPALVVAALLAAAVTRPLVGLGLLRGAAVTAAVAGVLVALAACLHWRRRRLAVAVGLIVATGAALLDAQLPGSLYRPAHEALELFALGGVVAATGHGTWRWAIATDPRRLGAGLAVVVAAAGLLLWRVDALAPGWRAASEQRGRFGPSLARAFRSAVDLDADGFSPVAWGGDCDDWDGDRHPLARETAGGGDQNCNGARLAADPTDDERGLAPPIGDPDLPAGAVDLVLLVTIDCLRADALRPEVMPRLTALATRGLTLERLYAAGSRTRESLPLLHRGTREALPVAARLAARGVTTSAVLGLADQRLDGALDGFGSVAQPARDRWDAAEVTDRVLAAMAAAGAGPRFVWAHYYDPHDAIVVGDAWPRPARQAGMPAAHHDYLAALAHVDAELGRLLGELERRGSLARAVVIVTSDHGEGFGEHGVWFHGVSAYEAIVRVPAVLVAPGVAAGVKSRALLSHRDLPATILGAFAAAGAEAEQMGRSWFRLRAAVDGPLHRFVVTRSARTASGKLFQSFLAAVVDDSGLKLIETFEDGVIELYDVTNDPGETKDLASERPGDVARLRSWLAAYRDIDQYP